MVVRDRSLHSDELGVKLKLLQPRRECFVTDDEVGPGNETAWIDGAIRRALKMVASVGLDVRLVSFF